MLEILGDPGEQTLALLAELSGGEVAEKGLVHSTVG
jgi:hypothetical protein